MSGSESSFVNQLMYYRNPSIQTFDSAEFDNVSNVANAPISHEIASQSYQPVEERMENIHGFKYVPEWSTDNIAVYRHDGKTAHEKRVVFGYRGSSVARDFATDVALTGGSFRHTRHAREAMSNFDRVRSHTPGYSYHLTGHSLGGYTSSYVHHSRPKTVSSSIGYNAPGSIQSVASDAVKKFYRTRTQRLVEANRVDFQNSYDPVSVLSRFRRNRKTSLLNRGYNPHSLGQWRYEPEYFR